MFIKNYLFGLIWFLVLGCVIYISLFYEFEGTSFYGIAETQELVANSEKGVEIKRINVVEGQSIVEGHLLVELSSPELSMKTNYISHQIDQLKAQKGISKTELKSKIDQLKAERAARRNEINSRIKRFENELEINKALTAGLKSIRPDANTIPGKVKGNASNPIKMRIESLKQELTLALNPIDIQIELFKKELNASGSPIKIRIQRLENELKLLTLENDKLNIYSPITGVIGSINHRAGEKIEPFAPILTLHTKTPSFIKGFINENVYTRVDIGEKLKVRSVADSKRAIVGDIVGVGSRIVEYPVRLKKHPELQVWGREVTIKIPENNAFILGEKVMINSTRKKTSVFKKLQNVITLKNAYPQGNSVEKKIKDIKTPKKSIVQTFEISAIIPKKTKNIEASGLLYLADIDRYLVISDESKKNPSLFLMNAEGRVMNERSISDLSTMSDMESIVESKEGLIFIASSLSANKKGKTKKSRRILIVIARKKDEFKLIKQIDLYDILKNSAQRNQDKPWAGYYLAAMSTNDIDIEGMFYNEDTIYLGFKTPLQDGKSVIIKIDMISELLNGKKPDDNQISVWKTFRLHVEGSSSQERISDLYYENGQLYITGSLPGERSGSLWHYNTKSGEIARLIKFDNVQPEGITAGKEKGTFMICFDQGTNNPSKITLIKVI